MKSTTTKKKAPVKVSKPVNRLPPLLKQGGWSKVPGSNLYKDPVTKKLYTKTHALLVEEVREGEDYEEFLVTEYTVDEMYPGPNGSKWTWQSIFYPNRKKKQGHK